MKYEAVLFICNTMDVVSTHDFSLKAGLDTKNCGVFDIWIMSEHIS